MASSSTSAEKEPKLKFDDMIPIFQMLPTSELVRFISNIPKPILGKFFTPALQFVLEKRLPFSATTKIATDSDGVRSYHVMLYDSQLSVIDEICRPELFRFSPLSSLTEGVSLMGRNHSFDLHHVVAGNELIGSLSNLESLEVLLNDRFDNLSRISKWRPNSELLSPEVKRFLPQLQAFKLIGTKLSDREMLHFVTVLCEMTDLKRLRVDYELFMAAMPAVIPFAHPFAQAALCREASDAFAGVEILHIRQKDRDLRTMRSTLQFLSQNCSRLRELVLNVVAPLNFYLAAFQSMEELTKLGFDMCYVTRNELGDVDNASCVNSVIDFRFQLRPLYPAKSSLFAVLAKFPNVRYLTIQCCSNERDPQLFQLVCDLCSQQIFPHLSSIKFFTYGRPCKIPSSQLLEFLKNLHLPRTVDLSQLPFEFFVEETDFLVKIDREMQSSSVEYLAMKGAIHRDALPFLRTHLAAERRIHDDRDGKVTAWRAQGFCPHVSRHQNASEFTDFKIIGKKTSGPLKGERFTVRIFNERKIWIDIYNEPNDPQ